MYGTPGGNSVRMLSLMAQTVAGSMTRVEKNPETGEEKHHPISPLEVAPYLEKFISSEAENTSSKSKENVGVPPSNDPEHPYSRSSSIPLEEILKIPQHKRSFGQIMKLNEFEKQQAEKRELEKQTRREQRRKEKERVALKES